MGCDQWVLDKIAAEEAARKAKEAVKEVVQVKKTEEIKAKPKKR